VRRRTLHGGARTKVVEAGPGSVLRTRLSTRRC
jgi:hypothetical protein